MEKYIHVSFDDVSACLEDITKNEKQYQSVFDNPFLRELQQLHAAYGAVFSLYCFWRNGDTSFDLSKCTGKFVTEFARNADWLRFGFHALDRWGDAWDFTAETYSDLYEKTMTELERIAGTAALDTVPRLHCFRATAQQCAALAQTVHGLKGLLGADTKLQRSYYFMPVRSYQLLEEGWMADEEIGLHFVSTAIRLEKTDVPKEQLQNLQKPVAEVFTHEWCYYDNAEQTVQKLRQVCEYAEKTKIPWKFAMDCLPALTPKKEKLPVEVRLETEKRVKQAEINLVSYNTVKKMKLADQPYAVMEGVAKQLEYQYGDAAHTPRALLWILNSCKGPTPISKENSDSIAIHALMRKDDASQGNEVWIVGAIVDDIWYSATEMFGDKWISKGTCKGWRSYDARADMRNAELGRLPKGRSRTVYFEKNRWRGHANVYVHGTTYPINPFADCGDELLTMTLDEKKKPWWKVELDDTTENEIEPVTSPEQKKLAEKQETALEAKRLEAKPLAEAQLAEVSASNGRLMWIDLLRALACFCVVGIHCNTAVNTFEFSHRWMLSSILNGGFYWANGVFFMLSGAMLIGYLEKYDTKTFFQKRITRVFVPFLFWSILAGVIRIATKDLPLWDNPIQQMTTLLLSNGCMYNGIYWFFYALLGIYLSIPLLSLIPEKDRKNAFGYLVGATYLLSIFLPFMLQWRRLPWNDDLKFPMASGYLAYAVWGYWLMHYEIKKKTRYAIYAGGVIGFGLLAFGTMYFSFQSGSFWTGFCGWANVPAFGICTAVFTAAKYGAEKITLKKLAADFLSTLASAGFGVYLVHELYLQLLIRTLPIDIRTPLWMIGGTVVIYALSLGTVLLLKKIPGLKKLVP